MDIKKLLEEVFTDDLFADYVGVTQNSINEDALKKTGTFTKTINEKDGLVTEIIDYESFDGGTKFSKLHTYYKNQEIDFKLKAIEERIYDALHDENYEKAAELKKEKDNLLNLKK